MPAAVTWLRGTGMGVFAIHTPSCAPAANAEIPQIAPANTKTSQWQLRNICAPEVFGAQHRHDRAKPVIARYSLVCGMVMPHSWRHGRGTTIAALWGSRR